MTPDTRPDSSISLPSPSEFAHHWRLDPDIVYLNHGSFGACPIPILQAQSRYREQMEAEAVRFFVNQLDDLLDTARRALAAFINCPTNDLAFVTNATIGVATVLDNAVQLGRLKAGDEVIASAHEYPACLNNLRRICARAGAQITMADIPFPLHSPDQVVDAILAKVTPRTRLALVSHVTSSSGLVLPIQTIVDELKKRNVQTIVDGAHAPGFTDLDITKLAPAYYTANCHKWICSPKGSAFLYVRPDLQKDFRPVILSNFAEKPKPGRPHFITEFDYIGTYDATAFIAIHDTLRFMTSLMPAGYADIRKRNRELLLWARNLICQTLNVEPPAPDSMLGSLSSIFLPKHDPHDTARHARLMARPSKHHDALQDAILKHRIQVPVWSVAGKPDRLIRLSTQLYNSKAQYEYLAQALKSELEAERSL
ncbi:MAG: aminotransferase class V-fold PLP-dependent enzyme [Phycisphaerales bacterium]|nr:aminotransferase class V-fold PLP-dependent enzyme [Phycisphaerales bacterium]